MTRKDYRIIAGALLEARPDVRPPGNTQDNRDARLVWSDTASRLATALALDNGRFDRDKFLGAAGFYQ